MALTFGLTGHRPEKLNEIEAALETAITSLLDLSRTELTAVARASSWYSDDAPLLRLITGFAQGADRIGIRSARRVGAEVVITLPFERTRHGVNLSEADRAELAAMLECDPQPQVLELPGRLEAPEAAYETVGLAMLAHADVLIAVWDGRPPAGRGGTAEILEQAVRCAVPVVYIDATGAAAPTLLWAGFDDVPLEAPTLWTVPRHGLERLPELLGRLVAPPRDATDSVRYRDFEGDTPRPYWLGSWYRVFIALFGLGHRHHRVVPADLSLLAGGAESLIPEVASRFSARLQAEMQPIADRADVLAMQYAALHRGGTIMNFSCAAFAVLLALLGLMVTAWKVPLLIVEIALIGLVLWTTYRGMTRHWHGKWLDYRHLAERVRVLMLSSWIGEPMLRDLDDFDAGIPGWVNWRTRAASRLVGPPSGAIDGTGFAARRRQLLRLVVEQFDYHAGNLRVMERLDHRTHAFGTFFFAATLGICLLLLSFKLLHGGRGDVASLLLTAGTAASVALPAFGAAMFGIRIQLDFAGMARRSERLCVQLESLRNAIAGDSQDYVVLLDRARRLAQIMVSDISDWRVTYRGRPFALPA